MNRGRDEDKRKIGKEEIHKSRNTILIKTDSTKRKRRRWVEEKRRKSQRRKKDGELGGTQNKNTCRIIVKMD